MALTDMSGSVVNSYACDPFGVILARHEQVAQPFQFVGQYGVMAEPEGLYYMRARYYDPNVGRFISEDPKGFDGGDTNLYAYTGNNPIMGVDPDGKFWVQAIGGLVGAAFGGYSGYISSGGDWGGTIRSAAVGAVAGVVSTLPIPGLSAAVGNVGAAMISGGLVSAGGNYATQVATGAQINYGSIAISGVAGALGGGIGAGLAGATTSQVISGPVLQSVRSNPIFTSFGQQAVSATVGGIAGGGLDALGQSLYNSCGK